MEIDIETMKIGVEGLYLIIWILTGNAVISEALPFLSRFKSNSTLQLIFNTGKIIAGWFKKEKARSLQIDPEKPRPRSGHR